MGKERDFFKSVKKIDWGMNYSMKNVAALFVRLPETRKDEALKILEEVIPQERAEIFAKHMQTEAFDFLAETNFEASLKKADWFWSLPLENAAKLFLNMSDAEKTIAQKLIDETMPPEKAGMWESFKENAAAKIEAEKIAAAKLLEVSGVKESNFFALVGIEKNLPAQEYHSPEVLALVKIGAADEAKLFDSFSNNYRCLTRLSLSVEAQEQIEAIKAVTPNRPITVNQFSFTQGGRALRLEH